MMQPVTITFKQGAEDRAEEVTKYMDYLYAARRENGQPLRVCCTNKLSDGRRQLILRFDDELDYLAFMVMSGGASLQGGIQ
jgi:hypothetical protein